MKMAAVLNLSAPWGALPGEWDHFDLALGLTADLLPVVSNAEAVISPRSKLAEKGKVPSVYNREGHVVGMPKWTERQSTSADVGIWTRQPDYGISIQSRRVRAIDADITDPALALRVQGFIAGRLGVKLPCRTRGNASKFLLAFEMPGEFRKRIIPTPGGNIEFLANGQQFVACGTHPSRARYVWVQGLPSAFPPLAAEAFEGLWQALAEEFGNGESIEVGGGRRGSGSGQALADDDVAEYLDTNSWTMGQDKDGHRLIRCPFESGHSTGHAGDGSTIYLLPGGDYQQGHFKCLHASCAGRSHGDFIHGVGYLANEFTDLPAATDAEHAAPVMPAFARHQKTGEIFATIDNIVMALGRPDLVGGAAAFDTFREELMLAEKAGQWRPFKDADAVAIRHRLEKLGFKPFGRELMRDVVGYFADSRKFDSAREWVGGLAWDGTPRVERFMHAVLGAEGTDYTRAVGRYIWTAQAGRLWRPGVKADMMPVLEGAQGARKSTAVSMLAPSLDLFCEINLLDKDADLARTTRGRCVVEVNELRGLATREMEHIKSYLAKSHDDWIQKYREYNTVYARRCLFYGTTNADEFLTDPTGNRRFLPVRVGVAGAIEVELLIDQREQLWAEGLAMFQAGGVDWSAEKLAAEAHEHYRVVDDWEHRIDAWLHQEGIDGKRPADAEFIRHEEVMTEALGFRPKEIRPGDQKRASAALRVLGWVKQRTRRFGGQSQLWVKANG